MPNAILQNTQKLYFSERMNKAMAGILDCPLTVIEAPMGYGKTTAVREYLNSTDAVVLWQRIYDNSKISFWKGFCQAISELNADCAQSLEFLGLPNDSVSRQEALKLIEGIKTEKDVVFVIDDYHLLNGTEVDGFIEFIVKEEIDHLNIVLTARFISLPSKEELILKGYLHYIKKEIFELTPMEIRKYYKLCGVNLNDDDIEKLSTYTEGWISALYLLMVSYKKEGTFEITGDIYKLFGKVVYEPFSEEIKEFLMGVCLFESFTLEQALHMWRKENAEELLQEIIRKTALIKYDLKTKTYQAHNIFNEFCRKIFESLETENKKKIYSNVASWNMKVKEYLQAMKYFYLAEDFDNLLLALELDKTKSIGNEQRDLLIKYFEECPAESKRRYPIALLVYAMNLMTLNEMERLRKLCGEFGGLLENGSFDTADVDRLKGEFELLLSFTKYNSITGMQVHHQKACELLREPTLFMDTKGSWTFGSPSVLYMFYRESGKLDDEVEEMKEAMPYYYQLTNGHGMGSEHVMEGESYFNRGDFVNAEIAAHKAIHKANRGHQPNIIICAQFLMARLSLIKGDYIGAQNQIKKMHEEMEHEKYYSMMHTLDLCDAFLHCSTNQKEMIPLWIAKGDFASSRLLFPAMAFLNIIYGRSLLISGAYGEILGRAGQFIGIASVFPNLLGQIYSNIYIAASNNALNRHEEALEALKRALDMAQPDQVYMPFVENGEYIKALLEELLGHSDYKESISRILDLYSSYEKALKKIQKETSKESKPELSGREAQIAQLAAEGFSNKEIGEKLFVSQNTVKTVLKKVFEKLGINSRSLLKQHFEKS